MGGLASRIVGGFNKGRAGGIADRLIGGHPQNWWLRLHGARDLSVIIDMGSGNAWWCLHPWNSLRGVDIVQCCDFLKFVRMHL